MEVWREEEKKSEKKEKEERKIASNSFRGDLRRALLCRQERREGREREEREARLDAA